MIYRLRHYLLHIYKLPLWLGITENVGGDASRWLPRRVGVGQAGVRLWETSSR